VKVTVLAPAGIMLKTTNNTATAKIKNFILDTLIEFLLFSSTFYLIVHTHYQQPHSSTSHQRAGIPSGLELRLLDVDLEPFSFDNTEWGVIHNQGYPDLWLRNT